VEADGSVRFRVPANALVYFQALDSAGRAVQTMRSATYVQPGAHVTCLGCHESKHRAPPMPRHVPLALRRPPREPEPGPAGSDPVFYPGLVQPVLDRHCVACHADHIAGRRKAARMPPDLAPTPDVRRAPTYDRRGALTLWTRSYRNLVRFAGRNFGGKPVKYEGRTRPGSFGSLDSRLYPMLADGKHHGVKLLPAELKRLAIWMDLNSNFLGHYLFTEEQSRGILPALPPTSYFDTSDHPEACIPIVAIAPPEPERNSRGPVGSTFMTPSAVRPTTDSRPALPDLDDLGLE
jgi:hypothetical protein